MLVSQWYGCYVNKNLGENRLIVVVHSQNCMFKTNNFTNTSIQVQLSQEG